MLRDRVNVSEKVAALEALLERVQRNAAEPRPPRFDIAAQVPPGTSPALAAQEPPADSLSDWAVSSISPVLDVKPKPAGIAPSTAPYPVIKDGQGLTPPGPPVSPAAAAPAAKRQELEPPPISAWPDIGPPSYPTLPGIAGPPIRPAAVAVKAAPAAPPVQPAPPPEEISEAITVQAGALRHAAAAFEPAEVAPADKSEAQEKAAPPAAIVPAEQARPDRSAVIRTLPGVGLDRGDDGKKPEDKLAEAVGAAQAEAKVPGAKAAADRKAAPLPAATPKPAAVAPVAPLPKVPETPAAAKPGLTAAKTPALAPIKSPLVSLPKRPLSTPTVPTTSPPAAKGPAAPTAPSPPAASPLGKPSALSSLGTLAAKPEAPKAPHAKTADAAKAAGQKLGIEPPAAVLAAAKNLGAKPAIPPPTDSDDSMATTIDIDESPTARPVHADEMTRPLASVPAENAPEKALPSIAKAREEDAEAEEATVMKTSPLEAIKVAPEEPEESTDEPTLMRPSPLETEHAAKEEPEESADEPTLMRPSPLETPSDLLQAAKELTAPEQSKTAAKATETKAAPGLETPQKTEMESAVPPSAEPLFSPELQPPEEQTETSRDTVRPERRKARRAPLWGFVLAALALAGAGVVVAVDKGWIGRFVEPTVDTSLPSSPTATAAPQIPTQTATAPVPTASASQEVSAPVPEQGDAGAEISDAGVSDASVSDAALDAAAPDAEAPDAAAPDAAAPAVPPAGEPSAAAPPGDPAALPDKKGYLTIKSAPSLHVYVQGAHAGLTNEALIVDCGPKFVRLGEPPATPPAGGGIAGVKWRSEGKSVVVACKGTTEFNLPASP